MQDVLEVKCPALTVFQPLLCGLIAADIEVPGVLGHVAKVLLFVYIDFPFNEGKVGNTT